MDTSLPLVFCLVTQALLSTGSQRKRGARKNSVSVKNLIVRRVLKFTVRM